MKAPKPNKHWLSFYLGIRDQILMKKLDAEEYGDNLILEVKDADGQTLKLTLGAVKIMAFDELMNANLLQSLDSTFRSALYAEYDSQAALLNARKQWGRLNEFLYT